MKLQIDIPHRYACMRAHTATHLLHAELGKIFPQTKQAGSYVGPDELRFDFFAERNLTAEEIKNITNSINMIIAENQIVTVQEMSYEQAIQTGAKAFFEDTYPEVVRVVKIGASSGAERSGVERSPLRQDPSSSSGGRDILSIELCGGTHVAETGQIGSFFITEQTAVAAGVKRIVALTGPKVSSHLQEVQAHLDQIAHKVDVPVKQLDAKIDKILSDNDELKNNYSRLIAKYIRKTQISGTINGMNLGYIICLGDGTEKDITMPDGTFKDFVESCRQITGLDISRIVYTTSGQYALFHPQAKQIAQELGLKGGGSDTFVQGRDEKIVGLMF